MSMIAHDSRHSQTQKRAWRAQRHNRTPEQRAQYVAESIALRIDEGRDWSFDAYGITVGSTQHALVLTALASIRGDD